MTELDDHELLAKFAHSESEEAFATLAARHVNLVYSAALRFTDNPHHAQEITQAVFIILARKAGSLGRGVVLSGWLYQTARFTAANFMKGEIRRQRREQEAYMQSTLNEPDAAAWTQIAPLLDEAMGALGETDRNAVVLRFFANKTAAEVATALKTTEAAAHKRVNRAVEKLRKIFSRRGVTLTATIIVGAVSANSVQAAPAGLAATVAAAGAKGAVMGSSTLALVNGALKLMAWAKMKVAIALGMGVLLAAGTATLVVSNTNPSHPNSEVQAIVNRSAGRYAALRSYSSTGTIMEEIDGKTLSGSFSMRLGRTNLYRVAYEFRGPGLTNKGAAWCDGSGDYFTDGIAGQTVKLPTSGPARNLGNLWDVSGGATLVVPAMFFNLQIPEKTPVGRLAWMYDDQKWRNVRMMREPDERVNEMPCFVVSAETDEGKSWLWICRDCLLVQKSRQQLKSKLPEPTDAEVTAILKGFAGKPPLSVSELRELINEAKKKATATMQPVTITFAKRAGETGMESMTIRPPNEIVFTQTHENEVEDQRFTREDFTR